MHPEARRRLEARLHDDGYSCEKFCGDLPYTFWNTCPLCLCGLLPVLVVCFSALFRLDYATHVTDIGAQIINEIGLSYTVYYTAGCWPSLQDKSASGVGQEAVYGSLAAPTVGPLQEPQCSSDIFEVAAGEFDALSGSLLRVRNVTKLRARRVEAVKVTPDWRYIVFVGTLTTDVSNLYTVGAQETDALHAVPLLTTEQLAELDSQCQRHSQAVLEALESTDEEDASPSTAAAATTKEPAAATSTVPATTQAATTQAATTQAATTQAATTQAATTTTAAATTAAAEVAAKAATSEHVVTDAEVPEPAKAADDTPGQRLAGSRNLLRRRLADGANPRVARLAGFKHLQVILPGVVPVEGGGGIDVASLPKPPEGSSLRYRAAFAFECSEEGSSDDANKLKFSKVATLDFQLSTGLGKNSTAHAVAHATSDLRVVDAEPSVPQGGGPLVTKAVGRLKSQSCPRFVPSRQGHELLLVAEDVVRSRQQQWLTPDALPSRCLAVAEVPEAGASAAPTRLLEVGAGALPFAPVRGCPEFVPDFYFAAHSLAEELQDNLLFKPKAEQEQASPEDRNVRDTFVVLSDPNSVSVLGVDAQVMAVSLPDGPASGAVSRVQLLYNVDTARGYPGRSGGAQLRLGGCQPIRAAGRKGHMRLQWALETLMMTLQIKMDKSGYTAWLACLTADQRIAIVESPKRELWINMSVPYPLWTGRSNQGVWCPDDREEACFEVWSNPNPNE